MLSQLQLKRQYRVHTCTSYYHVIQLVQIGQSVQYHDIHHCQVSLANLTSAILSVIFIPVVSGILALTELSRSCLAKPHPPPIKINNFYCFSFSKSREDIVRKYIEGVSTWLLERMYKKAQIEEFVIHRQWEQSQGGQSGFIVGNEVIKVG